MARCTEQRIGGVVESVAERLALTAAPTRLELTSGAATMTTPADHGHDLDADTVRRVWAAVEASTSASTKAAYRSDWGRFERWCAAGAHQVLPASPMVVAAYLTEAAAEGKPDGRPAFGAASLTRWASSINQVHTAAGHPAPGRSEVVRRALSGVRRLRKTAPKRRSPLLLADVRRLLVAMGPSMTVWPAGMAAHRDAALLLMGFAGASRRSELVGLRISDVTVHPTDGLHVRVRSSKTDQEGQGVVRALPYGRDPLTCPPCALVRWRRLLLAYVEDDGGRPAALKQLHQRGLSTKHVCRDDAVDTQAATPEAVDGNESTTGDDGGGGERWLFPTVHKMGQPGAKAMTGDAVAMMIQRRGRRIHAGAGGSAGRAFAAVRVRHRSLPGRGGCPLDHATDRTPRFEDARGVRQRVRTAGRQRRPETGPVNSPAMSAVTGKVLSASTRSGYATDWSLFVDWCTATDKVPLPADWDTVAAFNAGCPAAPATIRRRLAAIAHLHRAAGHPSPTDPAPTVAVPAREPIDPGQVDMLMRLLPSHGWLGGLFGRRDRALLTLAAATTIPYRQLPRLTVAQLSIADGTATVTDHHGTEHVIESTADPVLCGPCALMRWRRVLDTEVTNKRLKTLFKDAEEVTSASHHPCHAPKPIDDKTLDAPLFPPINQWGQMPFPLEPMSPHSTSRLARQADTGLAHHKVLDVDEVVASARVDQAEPARAAARPVYDWEAANQRKIDAVQQLAPLADALDDLEARIAALLARTKDLELGRARNPPPHGP